FAGSAVHRMGTVSLAEYLGMKPRYADNNMIGGSSFVGHVISAAMALEAGLCDVALIVYASNQRTTRGRQNPSSEPHPYDAPYKPRNPITSYALAASRHMYQYGTTREQLAEVAVAARGWANLNPESFMTGPLTIADVLKSPMVCDPFTVRDCCLITD